MRVQLSNNCVNGNTADIIGPRENARVSNSQQYKKKRKKNENSPYGRRVGAMAGGGNEWVGVADNTRCVCVYN